MLLLGFSLYGRSSFVIFFEERNFEENNNIKTNVLICKDRDKELLSENMMNENLNIIMFYGSMDK